MYSVASQPKQMGSNWLRDAGDSPGLSVWRVDGKSSEISTVPKGSFGVLRADDAYIHLDTSIGADPSEKAHSIFLWLGKANNQEELVVGLVADLETKLNGRATRYRECQDHESSLFLSMFKFRGGVQYIEPLSLQKQKNLREEAFETKLYHLKGRRNVRVKQVEISFESMNKGDVFVLDCNDTIYQWNGVSCSRMEKAKALDLTVRLRDERMNRLNAKVVLIDDGREPDEFWTALGGKGVIKAASEGGDDEEFEKKSTQAVRLYKAWIDGNSLQTELLDTTGQSLHRSMLDSAYTYVLDAETELFVWAGRTSPPKARDQAYGFAQKLLRDQGRPNWVPIAKVVEGVEPALFKSKFKGVFAEFIDNPEHLKGRLQRISKTAGTLRDEKVNVDALLHPEKYAIAREDDIFEKVIPSKSSDDESELKIWFIRDNEKHELPLEEYGFFYSHESYIVHYSVHLRSGGYKHVVYFWQGRKSAKDDAGSAALLASSLASRLGRSATQVRVVQNKEPEHFLSHFEGYMVVRKGKRIDWADSNRSASILYQLRGTNRVDTRAIQVHPNCASLNSNDAFLLDTPSVAFAWIGKGANEFERSLADTVPKRVLSDSSKKIVSFNEGEESVEFWTALGGKTSYSDQAELAQGDVKARLFQVSDRTSVLKAVEIHNFTQDDLDSTDVMILDAFHEVFVWIGRGSTEREKKEGVKIAQDYIKLADDGRSQDSPIYVVNQGEEPPLFTVYFQGWDDAVSQSDDDLYARKLKTLSQFNFFSVANGDLSTALGTQRPASATTSVGAPVPATTTTTTAPVPKPTSSTGGKEPVVDYDRLKVKPLPEGVDPQNKEQHLSDKEFLEILKMSREAWAAVPKWKQLRIKKETSLF